jgi:hypothetical protein
VSKKETNQNKRFEFNYSQRRSALNIQDILHALEEKFGFNQRSELTGYQKVSAELLLTSVIFLEQEKVSAELS